MKLTNEQIEYVENYIISKDIKWYELQLELTDHMVSSMEEFWTADPELTFHQVKHYAEDKFGRNGFKAIEEERTQILKKEFRKNQWKLAKEYLKFPKILGSILFVFIIYKATFYFNEPIKLVGKSFAFLAILAIPILYSYCRNRKIQGKRFLELNLNHGTYTGIFGIMYWILFLLNSFKVLIQQYPILILPFCLFWVLGLIFLITGIHIQNKIVENIKKQYQLT